jgi:hypothetical protein
VAAEPEDAAEADGDAAPELAEPLDEHPAAVTSTTAAAASAARAGRAPRGTIDVPVIPTDTALPTPDLYLDT